MSARPAATHVLGFVAAEADVCVILRRGLGNRTLMIRWDLATDTFEMGQWLFARLWDGALSDDGRLFAYHAMKKVHDPRCRSIPTEWESYNVVSRPPFFTALAFWYDATGEERLRWAGDGVQKKVRLPQKGSVPEEYRTQLFLEVEPSYPFSKPQELAPKVLRPSCRGELILYRERLQPDFYSLDDDLLAADWAEVDHRGRVLVVRKGRVYVLDAEGEREMVDLNPLEFRPLAPPRWAKHWPKID